ncbi:BZ3500_MvSof-1268-A1-R1_Chr7-2g09479 [Microbotryum saponariae]|uniref:BZ3500_MvSof-1268-A1-R1_Chr7-2g09479 protein n=1 Tax=Microbotryum saponariae TaxID=289078 RepID=A0A2X0NBY8_9BASI|nr:BZ3501_MvSof-1269-A2-R1_Chr7-1g09179 [Microbotryum saponariae]SDA02527.1 BZ3500_MvSof-1268-A1-R1_Chr7-2g09479 [Microbotryum saponariae]
MYICRSYPLAGSLCKVSFCPTVSNGVAVCTTNSSDFNCNTGYNKCNNTCNTGYKKVNGACLPNTLVCDVTKCPSSKGTPICTSESAGTECDITCDTGYNKKSIAFYDNFRTTKNGEPTVTVASIDACAAYCLASRGCVLGRH